MAVRGVGAAIQQDVAARLTGGVVGLVNGRGEPRFTGERIRLDQLLLLRSQFRRLSGLRNQERTFHCYNKQLPAIGLHAHRVTRLHFRRVEELHCIHPARFS